MNLNEPNAALRRIRTRFYVNGAPVSSAHTFGAHDLKIIKPDGTVVDASSLPTATVGSVIGNSFDIQVAQSELNQIGLYTWQIHGTGIDDWDFHDQVVASP